MIVETPHGEFEVNDITRKQRREHYGKVKMVHSMDDEDITKTEKMHSLVDEFTLLAFSSEEEADKKLEGLSALEEDTVLTTIILAYMGLSSGNSTGD
tara:strand:+ start:218 stop:508 length:291 start_codon:yes stop_codon:yes gene_type:complete